MCALPCMVFYSKSNKIEAYHMKKLTVLNVLTLGVMI